MDLTLLEEYLFVHRNGNVHVFQHDIGLCRQLVVVILRIVSSLPAFGKEDGEEWFSYRIFSLTLHRIGPYPRR